MAPLINPKTRMTFLIACSLVDLEIGE